MTNEELRRMMALVDEQYIDELTEEQPRHMTGEPAEIVTGEAIITKASPWPAITAIAAAVVILLPAAWFGYRAVKGQGIRPGEEVTEPAATAESAALETTELSEESADSELQQQLAEANEQDYPWKGHVLQIMQLGTAKLDHVGLVKTKRDVQDTEELDALFLSYFDKVKAPEHSIELFYMLDTLPDELQQYVISGDELSPDLIGTEKLPKPEEADGQSSFVIDYGTYRLRVTASGTTSETLAVLIEALQEAAPEPADPEEMLLNRTDGRYITYEEAVAFADYYVPDKVMGYEDSENPSIMTLNEDEIQLVTEINRSEDGSTQQSEYLTLLYEGNSHELQFTIAKGDYAVPENMPEIDCWSMKRVVWEPAAVTVEDRLMDYSFFCRNEDVTVTVQGRATIDEIDAFSQFYELAWQGGKYAAPLTPIRSVSELNEPDAPWKGEVPELEQIGDFRFSHALFNRYTDPFSNREIIQENIEYYGTIEGTGHSIQLAYTTQTPEEMFFEDRVITPEEFDAATILSEERLRNGDDGSISFVLYTDRYRIVVKVPTVIEQDDLQTILEAIIPHET